METNHDYKAIQDFEGFKFVIGGENTLDIICKCGSGPWAGVAKCGFCGEIFPKNMVKIRNLFKIMMFSKKGMHLEYSYTTNEYNKAYGE